ncbi:UNVERIFIED_CONTAM: hypothetical protein FKN15_022641 [Acipenser sinensis]
MPVTRVPHSWIRPWLKVTMTDKPNSTVNFRKLLLNRCQKEFERDKVDDDVFERKQKELEAAASSSERERLQEELKEAKDKARRRSIGNIKFIGELFKLRMLTEAIMHDCVVKLLKNHDEESLECLCRLLTTIGKDLDFEKAKPRMDQYFNQMEKIVKERKTSSRIRFMLQDVIDLRLHNWVSRRVDQGPKTIEQIHKEAKIEEQEEQRKVHQQLLSKDKRRPALQREETWNTVPMSKNSRTIDPSKIPKISKPTIDDKIQLGPRAQMSWGKGSSGGAKASESDASRSSTTNLNRFSALQSSAQPAIISPPTTPASEFDSHRSLTSRSSTGRERNDKPVSTALSRPATFTRGSSNKELLDNQVQEEQPREAHETVMQLPTGAEEKTDTDTDRSGAYDTGKPDAPAAPAADKPAITEEEMERKSKSIIDEFLHINDYKEAVQCVEELCMPSMLHVFVRVGVESTLERSQITRDHMGQLLFQLVQSGCLSTQEFFKGFAETLEFADDMAIDVPHIWLYLAELVIPMFREGGISMRELLSEFSKPLLPVGRAGVLLSEILHQLCKQMSQRKVGALWRESGLNWIDFLPEEEDVHNFISDQKLQFTLSDCSSPPESLSKRDLSPDELNRQLEKLLLEDIVSDEQIFDWVEEAVQCVEELCMPSMLHVFVRVGVESTLERSQITRDHMGRLLFQLVQSGSLSTLEFFKGFAETLEFADDMAIDVPHIWLYLAELVIPMFREGGISMRELLSEFSKPLLPVGRAGVLLSEILHQLCKQMSQRKVGALWRESGLNWIDFLPEEEDVHNFISDQKLQFTLSDCSSPPESLSKRDLSPDELNRQLEKLLLEDLVSDEQIFDWVEANLEESQMSSTPFLRALMTAVCKAAVKGDSTTSRVDTAIIQRRLPVLLKYLNSDTEKQLQALYALQALIVKLDQPPNLLRMFFDCLYDEDVISEDAFYKWEVSKDPGELEGKGVALKSVTAFFTWLREAEEESEDN